MPTVTNDNDITLAELRQDLKDQIAASAAQGFWTDTMLDDWLNWAGKKVCGFYRWPFLELAVYTTTRDSKQYYSYPQNELRFKPNSIYMITIEGEDYPTSQQGRLRRNWSQFQTAIQEEDDQKIFANHNGFYFLNPVPTDSKEMVLYGLKGWQKLTADADTPITPTEFDEVIVQLALVRALRKGKKYKEAQAEFNEIMNPEIGSLAMLKADIEVEGDKGQGGNAQSSRWGI